MNIVIVDDEPVSLTALEQLVEKLPACTVQGFTEAGPALDWCHDHDPDLVIVGYVMPELNGIEFTQEFRAMPGKADTPVLMVSASTDREVRNNAFAHGVNDFLNKPYDSIELQARVSNMLALRSNHQKLERREPFEQIAIRSATNDRVQTRAGLLDSALTLKRLAGDAKLFAQVSRVFVRTVPQLLEAIAAGIAVNDMEKTYAEAHSLKGAVAVFEAPQVLDSVVAVESQATNYNAAGASAAFAVARTLVERLVIELEPIINLAGDARP